MRRNLNLKLSYKTFKVWVKLWMKAIDFSSKERRNKKAILDTKCEINPNKDTSVKS